MSKRKAPEPSASAKASGKQKLTPDLAHMDSQDLLSNLLAGDDDENQGLALPSADDLGVGGEEDDDDGLAEALFDGDDLGDDDGADAPAAADDDEVGELPEGLEESHLTDPEEVDLSKLELTPPQARRVAQLLAQNSSLAKLKVEGASLDLSDLQDDELEWDSEEYGDVFAVRALRRLCTRWRARCAAARADAAPPARATRPPAAAPACHADHHRGAAKVE